MDNAFDTGGIAESAVSTLIGNEMSQIQGQVAVQPTKSDNGVDRIFGLLTEKLAERTSRKGFLAQARIL